MPPAIRRSRGTPRVRRPDTTGLKFERKLPPAMFLDPRPRARFVADGRRRPHYAYLFDLAHAQILGFRRSQAASDNFLTIVGVKPDHRTIVAGPADEIPHPAAPRPPAVGNAPHPAGPGAAWRRARITRPTVERLTPVCRASSTCVASGLAATAFSAHEYGRGYADLTARNAALAVERRRRQQPRRQRTEEHKRG